MKKINKEVIIYSTPTCHYCEIAKEFFKKEGINFKSINVAEDLEARKVMRDRSGQLGVPVIILNDLVIVGFTPEKGEIIKKEFNSNETN